MTERKKKRTVRSRPRGLSILPSLFTVGNIFCAFYSASATLKGNFDAAAVAIGLGAVLDGLDGRIARLTKTSSEFGVQLDSIADVLTFGMAPALLAVSWGFASIEGIGAEVSQHIRSWGFVAAFAFLICSALRLARFNIQSLKPPDSASKRYFAGLPTPASAGLVAAMVHFFKTPVLAVGSALLWCLLLGLVAFLMISTVRYPSFKDIDALKHGPRVAIVSVAMLIAVIILYSEYVLLALAVIYVASGPVLKLAQVVRRYGPTGADSHEPVHGNIKP